MVTEGDLLKCLKHKFLLSSNILDGKAGIMLVYLCTNGKYHFL